MKTELESEKLLQPTVENLFLAIREFIYHTLIHTFSFEILLPNIVVIPPEFDIKISAINV
jgi:hypothetical protein